MSLSSPTTFGTPDRDSEGLLFSYAIERAEAEWLVRVNGAVVGGFAGREPAIEAACAMARDSGRLGYPFEVLAECADGDLHELSWSLHDAQRRSIRRHAPRAQAVSW